MAVTKGHGNPNWTREETILALELFHQLDGGTPGSSDDRVIGLSNFLRGLGFHKDADRKSTFRNPEGVAFKLQNLRSVATGKGLTNVSATDRSVWAELGEKPEKVRAIAASIRQALDHPDQVPSHEIEFEFAEGRTVSRLHVSRERNPKVRTKLLSNRKANGSLSCEMCRADFLDLPEKFRDALFEAHHIIPLATATKRKTRLADMALLCACCHRLIHRMIALSGEWVTIEDAAGVRNGDSC